MKKFVNIFAALVLCLVLFASTNLVKADDGDIHDTGYQPCNPAVQVCPPPPQCNPLIDSCPDGGGSSSRAAPADDSDDESTINTLLNNLKKLFGL